MYELSGLPTYDLRPDGLYARSYVLLGGRTHREVRGEWRLVRPLPPADVSRLTAAYAALEAAHDDAACRRLLEAVHDGHSAAVAERLCHCRDTGEWYAVLREHGAA